MILALTGAGISKTAGIPTFAEQSGLRDHLERGFATWHPERYAKIISEMQRTCERAIPTKAHLSMKDANIPIITMNVDGLHQRAGSTHVLPIHGTLPDIVLYGDPAPLYQEAYEWVSRLREGDTLLIVGTSFYTTVSVCLRNLSYRCGADKIVVNEDADKNIPQILENVCFPEDEINEFFQREAII